MRNAIFMTFNDDYANYAKVCIRSLVENYPNHPEVLVYYDGSDRDTLNFLDDIKNLKVLPYNLDFLKVKKIDVGSKNQSMLFFRFILWTDKFEEFDTILHLDVDIIILKPLDDLFLHNDFFAVADFTSFGDSIFKKECYLDKELQKFLVEDKISLPPQSGYPMLNAGIFVIPKKYRNANNFNKLCEIIQKYHKFMFIPDQSSISLWCIINKITFSEDIRYNFQICFFNKPFLYYNELLRNDVNKLLSNIHIIHFTWWKPTSVYYKNLLSVSNTFIEINKVYSLFLEENIPSI